MKMDKYTVEIAILTPFHTWFPITLNHVEVSQDRFEHDTAIEQAARDKFPPGKPAIDAETGKVIGPKGGIVAIVMLHWELEED